MPTSTTANTRANALVATTTNPATKTAAATANQNDFLEALGFDSMPQPTARTVHRTGWLAIPSMRTSRRRAVGVQPLHEGSKRSVLELLGPEIGVVVAEPDELGAAVRC
jgi:hypothetical protein